MKIAVLGDYRIGSLPPPPIGKNLRALFGHCKAAVVNFEGPLRPDPAAPAAFKTGPALSQPTEALQALHQAGISAISIANNHANDFGQAGIASTVSEAARIGMQVAGLRRNGSPTPISWQSGEITVALLAFAEEEWCGDGFDDPGIAIIDTVDIVRAIQTARQDADAVILILHANNEYNPLPSPSLMKQSRFFIESGADTVLVHHAHMISGMETYDHRPILYGLGNFQFAAQSAQPSWNEGLCAVIEISRREDRSIAISVDPLPIVMSSTDYSVDLAENDIREQILREFSALSLVLSSTKSVTANHAEFVEANAHMYNEMLNPFAQSNLLLRLIGRCWVRFALLRGRRFAMMLNAYRCQSHREAMIQHLRRHL